MSISNTPGKIIIAEFLLINNYGTSSQKVVDIRPLVLGSSIYESVFDEEMCGISKIQDSNNLYSTLPITSDTYIKITLQDPTTGETVRNLFQIYKVSNIEQESPKLQTYNIQYVSISALSSRNIRITKHVRGNIPSVVSEIHKKMSLKPIDVTDDSTKCDIIIPYLPAKEAITFLVENAKWKNDIPDYCYWETFSSYNCKSLASCMLENPIHKISTNTSFGTEITEGFKIADFNKIDELLVDKNFDKLYTTYHGYDGAEIFAYNPLEGSCDIINVGANPLAKVYTYSSNTLDYANLSKRNQLLQNISNTYYYVQVPGLITRHSGDVADVTIYNGNTLKVKDTTLSGKRLICGIVHVFSVDDYHQNITLGDYYIDGYFSHK